VNLADLQHADGFVKAALQEGSNEWVERPSCLARAAASREEARPFGGVEEAACGLGGDLRGCGCQLRRDNREEAAALDEVLGRPRHPAHDLLGKVVVQVALATRETSDDAANLVTRAPADHRLDEPQRGRPPFRRARQVVEEIALQGVVVGVPKEALRLIAVETQVVRADLGGFSDGPQAGEGERGPRARRDDDRQPVRAADHELADDLPDLRDVVHLLIVVEDQGAADHRPRSKLGQERLDDRAPAAEVGGQLAEKPLGVRGERRIDLPARGDDVVDEDGPVAVVLIQAIPERANAGSPAPVREERGLAIAGIGDDEREPGAGLRVKPVQQPVAPKRLLGEERRLNLADLDRVAEDFHVVLLGGARGAMRDGSRPDRDEMRRNRLRIADEPMGRPSTSRGSAGGRQGRRAGSRGSHAAIVQQGAHRWLISTSSGWLGRVSGSPLAGRCPSGALVLEADLEVDAVLDDLPILDSGGRFDDLDRPDVPDGPGCGRDGLPCSVAP